MPSFEERRSGLLFGSFVAEAISLGVHWIYDPVEIVKRVGRVTGYSAPGKDSYHPHKKAGEQGHVGDQALLLAKFLTHEQVWDAAAFMNDWLAMWDDYQDYFDHATKTVLAHVKGGKASLDAASDSDELAGPARSAPLIAFYANVGIEDLVRQTVEHNALTHESPEAEEATRFLVTASHELLQGGELSSVIRESAPKNALSAADAVLELSAAKAIGRLGQSCSLSAALPSVIYLALRHGSDLPAAFVENAMAGGDSCARGLALGMLLGAAGGLSAIPQTWRNQLRAADVLNRMLESSKAR